MPAPPATPNPRAVDDALAVVHSPHLVHDQPALRLNAWATLMEYRGHGVAVGRLCRMQAAMGMTGSALGRPQVLTLHPGGAA